MVLPRTVAEVYNDFKGRRSALIKALTTDVEEFYKQCDPEKGSLCLYGYPTEEWEVNSPEAAPPDMPEPKLGINLANDGTKDWLLNVAAHSDSWLLSVAFFFAARFGFQKSDRERLFSMMSDLPTVYDVVSGTLKKKSKEKTLVSETGRSNTYNTSSNTLSAKDSERVSGSEEENGLEEEGEDGGDALA